MNRLERLCFVLVVTGCVSLACTSEPTESNFADRDSDGAIVVGSFDFTESEILADAYAMALEGSGYRVERLRDVASREIMEPALEQGFVDLVPEYQGALLTFLNDGRATEDLSAAETYRELKREVVYRNVVAFDYAAAENKNEIVVTSETATRYDLQTISDLQEVASDLAFGGPPECLDRPLCLVGLEERYGLTFDQFRPLDVGGTLTVAALEEGEVDVALLFTTNPEIISEGFVVLHDNLRLQPAENIVPVARSQVAAAYGRDFERIIDSVTARLSTTTLRDLNGRVEEAASPGDVARAWLEEEGLLQ